MEGSLVHPYIYGLRDRVMRIHTPTGLPLTLNELVPVSGLECPYQSAGDSCGNDFFLPQASIPHLDLIIALGWLIGSHPES